jgi:3-deoxy-D-manno-octulosonic-acid transferase
MKVFIYNVFILTYWVIAFILTPFNLKARTFTLGKFGFWKPLKGSFVRKIAPVAWFHCASLGEFEQGKPVIEAFKIKNPGHKILITFFSPSGYEQRKNYEGADYIYYLPIDTPVNVNRFLDIVKPDIVFFIKYEFWYNYLNQVHKRGIPLYNISGIFTPKHNFFKFYGGLHRKMLTFFNHFFVQDLASKTLLDKIGISNVTVSGDTRFDRVQQTTTSPNHYPIIEKFKGESKVIVIGSCWPEDMEVLYDFINSSKDDLKFIIAPHLVDEQHVKILEKGLKMEYVRVTEAVTEGINTKKVMIINTMGMLSSLYQYGEVAYIGGAFRDGVHNILEAVAFGLPVIFGNKNLDKFPETLELIELGGAFSVSNKDQASNILSRLLDDALYHEEVSKICSTYIQDKSGATQIIIDQLAQV